MVLRCDTVNFSQGTGHHVGPALTGHGWLSGIERLLGDPWACARRLVLGVLWDPALYL